MKILLTSFQHSISLPTVTRFSTARWMPKGFNYPELRFLAPIISGRALTTELEPEVYRSQYDEILKAGHEQLEEFIEEHQSTPILALCCWCSSTRQKSQEHLYCHTILIGHHLRKHFPNIELYYCDGRDKDWFADIFLGEEDNE